jgi:hypothetical protein
MQTPWPRATWEPAPRLISTTSGRQPTPDCHRPDVVLRPISDLPPFPLLLLTTTGRQRPDVEAFATLSATVANELNTRH